MWGNGFLVPYLNCSMKEIAIVDIQKGQTNYKM